MLEDRPPRVRMLVLGGSLLVIVNLLGIAGGIGEVWVWAFTDLVVAFVLMTSIFFHDAVKAHSDVLVTPNAGRLYASNLEPIKGTRSCPGFPAEDLYAFGGGRYGPVNMKDGGTLFRPGGYLIVPRWQAFRIGRNELHVTTILHKVDKLSNYPAWARAAIRNHPELRYDEFHTTLYVGLYSVLQPEAVPEALDLAERLTILEGEKNEALDISSDAVGKAIQLHDLAQSMTRPDLFNLRQALQERRARKQLQRDREER